MEYTSLTEALTHTRHAQNSQNKTYNRALQLTTMAVRSLLRKERNCKQTSMIEAERTAPYSERPTTVHQTRERDLSKRPVHRAAQEMTDAETRHSS